MTLCHILTQEGPLPLVLTSKLPTMLLNILPSPQFSKWMFLRCRPQHIQLSNLSQS